MQRLTLSTVLKFHRHIQKGKKNFLIWLKGLLSKRVEAEKKSAWTDLDKVSFKNFVKESNVEIQKLAWTDLDKVNFENFVKESNVKI